MGIGKDTWGVGVKKKKKITKVFFYSIRLEGRRRG